MYHGKNKMGSFQKMKHPNQYWGVRLSIFLKCRANEGGKIRLENMGGKIRLGNMLSNYTETTSACLLICSFLSIVVLERHVNGNHRPP
jgi:hypothetical protein